MSCHDELCSLWLPMFFKSYMLTGVLRGQQIKSLIFYVLERRNPLRKAISKRRCWEWNDYLLFLIDAPEVTTREKTPYKVIEGNTAILKCVVIAANPNEIISWKWFKQVSKVLHNQSIYTINNIMRSDSGSYSCTARNSIGTSELATINVDVLCKYFFLCMIYAILKNHPVFFVCLFIRPSVCNF